MSDTGTQMRMVGMIPMPEALYADAMDQCLASLRAAMSPMGLNPANLRPPPPRLMPVVEDQAGNRYALVETCNANFRPTAVPLSAFFQSAGGAGTSPGLSESDGFIPLAALENVPPPPADQDLQAAGNSASAVLSKLLEALPQALGKSQSPGGLPTTNVAPSGTRGSTFSNLGAMASRMAAGANPEMTSPSLSSSVPAATNTPSSPALGQSGPVETKTPTPEENTRALLALAKEAARAGNRPDGTGGLASMILGVTAAQNPKTSSAAFEKMLAEKAAGFAPTGGIYQRLQSALAALPPSPLSEG